MKTEFRDHPLGAPGSSARRMARSMDPGNRLLRLLCNLFPGLRPGASWDKGAEGEEAVAKALAKLPRDRWMTLHDRPLGTGGRNVDHLVIGPGGVFSVIAKNLSGKVVVKRNAFLVSGFPDRCLHVARDEARKVGGRLTAAVGAPVDVAPVVVVLAPSLQVQEPPEDVSVLGLPEVRKWLEGRPHVLEPAAAARIYLTARRNGVWTEPISALSPNA